MFVLRLWLCTLLLSSLLTVMRVHFQQHSCQSGISAWLVKLLPVGFPNSILLLLQPTAWASHEHASRLLSKTIITLKPPWRFSWKEKKLICATLSRLQHHQAKITPHICLLTWICEFFWSRKACRRSHDGSKWWESTEAEGETEGNEIRVWEKLTDVPWKEGEELRCAGSWRRDWAGPTGCVVGVDRKAGFFFLLLFRIR